MTLHRHILGLSQMVTFPTRLDNTVYVFLTNRHSLVNRCETIPGVSAHDAAVYVSSDIMPTRQRPVQKKIHIWKKAKLIKENIAAFAEEMQTRYNPDTHVETMWVLSTAKCQSVLANHFLKNCLHSATTSPGPTARQESCLERKRNTTRRPPSLTWAWQCTGLQRSLSNQSAAMCVISTSSPR